MPYSDRPPALVMPDTADGHREAPLKFPGIHVTYCNEWRTDPNDSRMCGNRRYEGDRRKNWCMKCLCGFMLMRLNEKEAESTRLGALSMTGW